VRLCVRVCVCMLVCACVCVCVCMSHVDIFDLPHPRVNNTLQTSLLLVLYHLTGSLDLVEVDLSAHPASSSSG